MELPAIRVDFYLTGENMDFQDITNRLKLRPRGTRKKEDFPAAQEAIDTWDFSTKKESCKATCWQFEKLMHLLTGKEEIIRQICKDYRGEVTFTIVVDMERGRGPELILTPDIIAFAASINAEIGFDLYID